MKLGACNRSSVGGFLVLRVHLSDGSYKAVNATPNTQCSTILEKIVGQGHPKEDFVLKVKYKNSSPSVLSDNTYLRDLIPTAKNDELEEISLCKKESSSTIRRFSNDLLLHSRPKPLDIVTVSLPLQREYAVAPVKNEKVASMFSSAWSIGTHQMEQSLSSPQDESASQYDCPCFSVERTRKVAIPVIQTQVRKRVGTKVQKRHPFRRSNSTCTLSIETFSQTCPRSNSFDLFSVSNAATDDIKSDFDSDSDTLSDDHYVNMSSLQDSRRRSLSESNLGRPSHNEYMEMKSVTIGMRRTASSMNCHNPPLTHSYINSTNHSLAKLKSSRSVELLTDDDIEHITEYTLRLESDDDSGADIQQQPPEVPERSSSLHSTQFNVPDEVLLDEGRRWNALLSSKQKKISGSSGWSLGVFKSAFNKVTRKISPAKKASLVFEGSRYSLPRFLAKSNITKPTIHKQNNEEDMAMLRYNKARSHSIPKCIVSITPASCALSPKHKCCSYTDISSALQSSENDYVMMSPACGLPFNHTRKLSTSQPSVADGCNAQPLPSTLLHHNMTEPVYDVPIRPLTHKTSQSLYDFPRDTNSDHKCIPVERSMYASPLQTPLPSPLSDLTLVPGYCDDAYTRNLDVTAAAPAVSYKQIDAGKPSWIYEDFPDTTPDC